MFICAIVYLWKGGNNMFVNTKKNNKDKSITLRLTEKQKAVLNVMCTERNMNQTELIFTLLEKEFIQKTLINGKKDV